MQRRPKDRDLYRQLDERVTRIEKFILHVGNSFLVAFDRSFAIAASEIADSIATSSDSNVPEANSSIKPESLSEVNQDTGNTEIRLTLNSPEFKDRTLFTVAEVARILGKTRYTVSEWCRFERIKANRERGGRGGVGAWRISREEILRYQNEGLLPDPRKH